VVFLSSFLLPFWKSLLLLAFFHYKTFSKSTLICPWTFSVCHYYIILPCVDFKVHHNCLSVKMIR
jgi:hypothetical protein